MEFKGFIEELTWRGMVFDHTPGVEAYLEDGARGYIGFDPTADSLTIGNFVQLMILILFQKHGHQPIVLMGAATGRIGDPSGKDKERELKSYDIIDANCAEQEKTIRHLLDFGRDTNPALLFNNHSFYREMNVLDFLRDVGKTLTINYMMSKDSVKNRIETGLSFTEFSYQLLQGYDFQVLYTTQGCALQMGGSDQWGNITSGTEFIRRNFGGKAYGITTPLLTKADGSKFGKSESGAIWLSANRTSPYAFYQYWLNTADADIERLIKYFSLKTREEMESMIAQIEHDPRVVKKQLTQELTARVHGQDSLSRVEEVSTLLFAKTLDANTVRGISIDAFDMVGEQVTCFSFHRDVLNNGLALSDLLTSTCQIFSSKSEFIRAVKGNALSINKSKIADANLEIATAELIHNQYIMIENGKKNKYLLKAL